MLSAIAIFPMALVIVQRSTLYDGVRHLLFIYPVIVALAAGGGRRGWRGTAIPGSVAWPRRCDRGINQRAGV